MQYKVLVQQPSEQHFTASIFGLSNIVADGKTEEEAIAKIKAALTSQLETTKFVTIDLESDTQIESGSTKDEIDPWMKYAGVFADDPTFDNFLEEVSVYRQQVDEKLIT